MTISSRIPYDARTMAWFLFLLPGLLVTLYLADKWKTEPKAPPMPDVSEEVRARLGDELATWLGSTRALRAQITLLQSQAHDMLAVERTLDGHRPFERTMADVDFLEKVRRVRGQAAAWQEQSERIRCAEILDLHGIDDDSFPEADLLALPWRTDHEAETASDRSAEIEAIVNACTKIGQRLAKLDGTLDSSAAEPYR